MHLTSPAGTPKSQVAGEQPLKGICWNPPKKKKRYSMSRDKGEATTDSRRDAIMLKSNLLPAVSDPQTEEQ